MKLGIVGGGVVGRATARAFVEHVDEVRVYDVVAERRTHPLDDVLDCSLVFVCLPTPQKPDSLECDLSRVDSFFEGVSCHGGNNRETNFVLRSTVPIGTTRRLCEQYGLANLVHSPEFLTARCALVDAQMPARNVIGSPLWGKEPRATAMGEDGAGCYQMLWNLYRRRFPGTMTYTMSSDESEAVKLFQNGFFACKIAYWNEVNALATKLGLDWQRIMDAILADGRICPSHTQVPGPDGRFGYGGTCLPKDLANLVSAFHANHLPPWVTNAALERNASDRQRTV